MLTLASAFAGELTKWLQVVLHQEPEKRGVAHNGDEAPCLLHIDRILKTKVHVHAYLLYIYILYMIGIDNC